MKSNRVNTYSYKGDFISAKNQHYASYKLEEYDIVDVDDLKNTFEQDPNLKLVQLECPINSNLMMIDISMTSKGVDEEVLYLQSPFYLRNIRRGNTLVEVYHFDKFINDYQLNYTLMARRGLMKFVDLPFEAVETNDNRYQRYKSIQDENKRHCSKLIMDPVLDCFSKRKKLSVLKLIKANGENAQISYIEEFKSWVIASKNVALLARNRNDLEYYPPIRKDGESTRFYFAYIIGQCFFDILEKMTKFGEELLKEFKKYISNKTFVGEYVGNQNHQHLVRYTKHTILFYSVVENYNENNCLPVLEAYSAFKKFKLDVVPYEDIGVFDNHLSLCLALEKLYNRIAESSIVDEEEGSVLYFSEQGEKEKVISLCKLKTLEYRVYRKLREKLKNHDPYDDTSRKKINQFFEEVRIMLQGYCLPMPMSFYYKVAETAFAFVNKFPEQTANIHSNYIDFLEVIHSLVDHTVSLKSQIFKSENMLTYDNLLNKSSETKKLFSLIIYAPPLYLPDEFLKFLQNKYETLILNSLYLEGNNTNNSEKQQVRIFHINMHNFKFYSKLGEDKLILTFGLNQTGCEYSSKVLEEKLKNPQFVSYNKNVSLTPFLKQNYKEREEAMVYFLENSKLFLENSRKYIGDKIKSFEDFPNNEEFLKSLVAEIDSRVSKMNLEGNDKDSINFESFANQNLSTMKYQYNSIKIYEQHINVYEALKESFLKNEEIKTINSLIKDNNFRKTIIILIPMTIPGTGKTFFVDQLKEIVKLGKMEIEFESISNDDIRRATMDEFIKRRGVSEEKAFELSNKETNQRFEEELRRKFNNLLYKKCSGLLYIDKNHPPNALSRVFETTKQELRYFKQSYSDLPDVKFVALIPDCGEPIKINDNFEIPFSLSYFIQCYLRIRNRKNHPTLKEDKKDLICILAMFIKNFVNLKMTEENLFLHYQFDKLIKLPFTDEIPESKLPLDLVKAAKSFLNSISIGNYLPKSDKLSESFENSIKRNFQNINCFKSTKDMVKEVAKPIVLRIFTNEETATLNSNINSLTSTKMNDEIIVIDTLKIVKPTNFVYLGLRVSNSRDLIYKEIVNRALTKFSEIDINMTEANMLLAAISKNELPMDWKCPHPDGQTWHITTLFKGKSRQSDIENHPAYKSFSEGKVVEIMIHGVVYLPYKTIFCVTSASTAIENEFPHMTTLVSGFAPKQSNDVMKILFDKNGVMRSNYLNALSNSEEHSTINSRTNVTKNVIRLNGLYLDCFVYFFDTPVILKSEMHAFN